jgi:broad specificity phosphatase PhoE
MGETTLLIVRHPETEANVNGRFVGRGQSPFTAHGRRQARRLPHKLVAFRPEAIWTSPLERAHVVAQRASRLGSIPLRVDDRLLELDFGDAEGMTYEEIAEAGMPFDYRSSGNPVAPNGESRRSIETRVAQVADEIVACGGRQVVVAHGGVVRAMLVHLLALGESNLWTFHIHNAQLATVRIVEGHGTLEEYVQG